MDEKNEMILHHKRRLLPGAEPWVRFCRGFAIFVRILCFIGILAVGLLTEPTWKGAVFGLMLAGANWFFTEVHEATNEILGIGRWG